MDRAQVNENFEIKMTGKQVHTPNRHKQPKIEWDTVWNSAHPHHLRGASTA